MDNKSRIKYAVKLSLFCIVAVLLVLGGTFAYWTWVSTEDKDVVFSTNGIEGYIVYDEGESHFVGDFQPYDTFCESVSTTVSVYKLKEAQSIDLRATIFMDVNSIGSNIASSNDVHWVLTDGDSTVSCSEGLTSGSVISSGTFNGVSSGDVLTLKSNLEVTLEEKKYTVWIWVDSNGDSLSSLSGETVDTNVWTRIDMADGGGSVNLSGDVNPPVVASGMIPVVLSDSGAVTTILSNDNNWYDYTEQRWANAVLVSNSSRSTYLNTTGKNVNKSDILAYYVWIPRYKYKLWTKTLSNIGSEQTIDIIFESANDTKSLGSRVGEYRTHPAFTFGNEELDGFWVGKFETTGSVSEPKVLPNVASLKNTSVKSLFDASLKFAGGTQNGSSVYFDGNATTYGVTNTFNSHMMKNSEWGAVAYLTHSLYGINKEVSLNSGSVTASNTFGTLANYPQSTTGNITGVFDMAGGTYEYVMGNYNNTVGGFSVLPVSKYYDLYTTDNMLNACNDGICYGHALSETKNWYSDENVFIAAGTPWFVRGGYNGGATNAGIFAFNGALNSGYGFRSVLLKTNNNAYYIVSYNMNGGTGSCSNQVKVVDYSLTLCSDIPTRTGYKFLGWNTAQNGSGRTYRPGGKYDTNAATTLYAQWKDDIAPTVTIGSTNNVATYQTVTVTIRKEIDSSEINNSGIIGYYFGKENPENNTNITWESVSPTTSLEKTYNVNSDGTWYFAAKDAAGNIGVVSKVFYKTTLDVSSVSNATVNPSYVITMSGNTISPLPTAYADQHRLSGWYTSSDYSGSAINEYTPSGNTTLHTLHAKFVQNLLSGEVTITGDYVYGSTLTANVSVVSSTGVECGSELSCTYSYQWYSSLSNTSLDSRTPIDGATSSTYTIGKGLVGKYIYVEVEVTADQHVRTIVRKLPTIPVAKKTLDKSKLTYSPLTKEYDGTTNAPSNFIITATAASGLLSGDSVTITYTGAVYNDANVASASSIIVSGMDIKGTDGNNYTFGLGSVTYTKTGATIYEKELAITAYSTTWVSGATTYARNNYSTGVKTETITLTYTPYANTPGTYTYATSAGSGKFILVLTGSTNYRVKSAGDLTLNKAPGSINYATTSVTKTYGDGSFTNTLTKTGDGEITYSSTDTSVATVNASTGAVTIVGAGSTTITATVKDGTNYTYATKTATYALTVKKADNPISVTTPQSWTTTFSTSSQTKAITAASGGQGTVSYSIQSQIKKSDSTSVTYFSISNTTVTMAASTPVGEYKVVIRATAAGNSNYNSGYKDIELNVTVGKQTVNPPTNVAVSTAGIVTWTASSNATGYQISIDNSSWTNATSGVDYLSTIIASTGSRTVYVRAVNSDNKNYTTPSSNVTKAVTVYKVTINSNDTTMGTVDTASYNVISGATVSASSNKLTFNGVTSGTTTKALKTVTATPKTGYSFGGWSKTSGSITDNTTITATFGGNTYTITYYLGKASDAAGSTSIGTSTCTYNSSCTLKTWGELGATFPNSNNKWTFAGWSTTETGLTVNHNNGSTITYSTAGNMNLYALGSRTFKFYSGVAPTTITASNTQYWNPYQSGSTYVTTINVPSATTITGWSLYGWRGNTDASSERTIKNTDTTFKPASDYLTSVNFSAIYSRSVSIVYNANGGTGTTASTTGTQYYNSGRVSSGANSGAKVNTVELTLASNGFSRSGHSFEEWNTKADGSGTSYESGVNYSFNNGVSASSTVTLYALWDATATISYATSSVTKTYGDASFTNPLTNSGDGTVTYTSSNTSVATVNSSTGAVTIVGWGSATITATVADSASYTYATKTASYTLTVDPNTVTVTIKKDGSAWSSSGINVALYSGTTAKYAYSAGTASGSTVTWSGVIPGTYNVYAGKSGGLKTTLVDTGVDVIVSSTGSATINYYTISRSQGTGTTLTTKYDSSSGTAFTSNTVMLSGITLWASSTASSGYNTATLKHGSTTMTASGATFTVSATETITSAATANTAKITIKKDGSAYSGLTVALYQSGTSKYASPSYASGVYTFSTVANGTYDIYVGGSDTGVDVTVSSNAATATLNYYTLTLNKGTGISAVSGGGVYLSGTSISIDATVTSGYTWKNWTGYSTTTTKNYTFTMPAQAVTYTANAVDDTKPAKPTISRSDYNTFTYSSSDGVGVTGYYVSAVNTSTAPTTSSTWVTTTSKDISAAGTYYVWARDAAGNISDAASIVAYSISRSQGTGTTLKTRYDATSSSTGTEFTSNTVMLSGTSVWASCSANTGYNTPTLKHGNTAMTASGATFTVSAAETISCSALVSKVIIKYHVNGGTIATATNNGGEWTTTDSIVYRNGSVKTTKINYGATIGTDGLDNYNNSNYINITKDGYTAVSGAEWKCLEGCTTANKTFNQTGTGYSASDFCDASKGDCTVVLGVNWTKKTYPVCYDANGGSGAPACQTKTHGTNLTLSSTKPTKTGYTFTGWNTEADGTGDVVQPGSTMTANRDRTFYAQWRINVVKINYHVNGGSIATTSNDNGTWTAVDSLVHRNGSLFTTTVNYGTTPGKDILYNYNSSNYINITKDGYTAVSGSQWICHSGCTTANKTFNQAGTGYSASDFCDASNGDCTVVLKVNWTDSQKPTCNINTSNAKKAKKTSQSVTLSCSDGVGVTSYYWGTKSSPTDSDYTSGTPSTKTVSSAGTYYLFAKDAAGNVSESTSVKFVNYTVQNRLLTTTGTKNTRNTTNYALNSNYEFTYLMLNNYTFQTPKNSMTVPTGGDENSYAVSIHAGTNNIPSDGSATTTSSPTINETDNVLVFWINRIVYTISYDACSGTGAPNAQEKRYGKTITLRTGKPTKTGYTFLGWNNDPETGCNGSVVYVAGQSHSSNASETLYAIYRINQVKINYNVNGGTIATETNDNGTWTAVDSLVHRNGSLFTTTVDYGTTPGKDILYNYNSSTNLNIKKTGYTAVSGAQWKCLEGCTTAGKTFNHAGTGYSASDFCDASNSDCTVVLGVNWTKKTYQVCYDANGGSGAPACQTKIHGEPLVLSSQIPTRDGYIFTAWNLEQDGSGTSVEPGATMSNNVNRTFWAQWSEVGGIPTFTYTGNYTVVDDSDNVITDLANYDGDWKIKFLTGGTFKSTRDVLVDVFLVGGGGGGGSKGTSDGGGGGGGGYTNTGVVRIKKGQSYEIVVGDGGAAATDGEASTAFGAIAYGGNSGKSYTGGNGGSGGGAGGYSSSLAGTAGGSNGSVGTSLWGAGGSGQGTNTREFGESTGKLYSGGGGGAGGYNTSTGGTGSNGAGGSGGGKAGGSSDASAEANTGGGGGGENAWKAAGKGGSGIVIIRNARVATEIALDYEYTGYHIYSVNSSGDWKIRFLTSGTFTPHKNLSADVFLVGGGGGGGKASSTSGGGGGGGGYTTTGTASIVNGQSYEIVVGDGGAAATDGNKSTAFNLQAAGGKTSVSYVGGAGGSGGGSGGYYSNYGAAGGSNGSAGTAAYYAGGTGQGTSTYEFGDIAATLTLYGGGGGGGRGYHNTNGTYGRNGAGGTGGGSPGGSSQSAAKNYGGGGGGGGAKSGTGGSGGSGIVVIRNARTTIKTDTLSDEKFYSGGNLDGSNSYFVGDTSTTTNYNWVVRYKFTAPSGGASYVSTSFNIVGQSSGTVSSENFYWYVTSSSTSHLNAYNTTFANFGPLRLSCDSSTCNFNSSSQRVNLTAGNTYYLYVWNARDVALGFAMWHATGGNANPKITFYK